MPIIDTPRRGEKAKQAGLSVKKEHDEGYESNGLLYFSFGGVKMVAVIRARQDSTITASSVRRLESYADTESGKAREAGLALEDLLCRSITLPVPQ